MPHLQKTLQKKVTFAGIGVHSGRASGITIWPEQENTGIIFYNAANPSEKIVIGKVIPEVAMHATVIKNGTWCVSTIEHVIAAITMLGITNAAIEVNGGEIPILDGSSLVFVQGILDAGITDQSTLQRTIRPKKNLSFTDHQGRSIELKPDDTFDNMLHVEYSADFVHPLAGDIVFQDTISPETFIEKIAPARTFGFLDQLPLLRQHNLAQGSALSNTVVIGQESMNDMRFADECVRHKVLDLIGDLSLLGARLVGQIKAHKTSHHFNRLVIEHFIKKPEEWHFL